MSESKEFRYLGTCKFCGKEIYGTHHNKYQSHQRWCLKNPNRNKTVEQARLAFRHGGEVANRHKKLKAEKLNEKHCHILKCKRCNHDYEIWVSDKDFKNGHYSKHCSYSCSNVRNTSEFKDKIGKSVKREHKHICPKCQKEFMHSGTRINHTFCDDCYEKEYGFKREFRKKCNNALLHKTNCKACNKIIWCKTTADVYCYECAKKLKKHIYQLYTPTGKKLYSKETRNKLSQSIQLLIKAGKHKGWSTSNKVSFPEIFWQNVLTNNGIKYETEVMVQGYLYRLDFRIKLSNGLYVDLEIDGKQHYYENRNQHDKLRDKRIRAIGYLVYRVSWNDITKKIGKLRMNAKIKQFFWWLDKVDK